MTVITVRLTVTTVSRVAKPGRFIAVSGRFQAVHRRNRKTFCATVDGCSSFRVSGPIGVQVRKPVVENGAGGC
eukprot:7231753-Prymnesium_polylepis.1